MGTPINISSRIVAVHLGVKMADTLSFTAKVDMVDFWVSQELTNKMRSGIVHHKSDRKSCVIPTADRNKHHVYVL